MNGFDEEYFAVSLQIPIYMKGGGLIIAKDEDF
jgi:hypothetical protein